MNLESFFTLSYGLYIISSESGEKKNGYVANTVFQVTATPEQLAISCNKDNLTEQIIAKSGRFSVSVLGKDASKDLIGTFGYKSGKNIDKFSSVEYFTSPNGIPVVTEGSVAWFECEVVQSLDVGTHVIFIGKVLDGEILQKGIEPMTYAYYHEVRKMFSPKNAPTYIDKKKLKENQAETKPVEKPKVSVKSMQKWECQVCGHIYDPAEGDPDSGIAPGTAFEDLPDDWVCPECGAEKSDFEPLKEKNQESAKEETTPKVSVKSMQKWECQVCGHIYDPAEGDPDSGIAPGTAFEDLPDDWVCPECGAEQSDFEPVS